MMVSGKEEQSQHNVYDILFGMSSIYTVLTDLQIPFEKYTHPAVHTVVDTIEHYKNIDAGRCKNLFLQNVKGDTYYLIVMQADKRLDIKKLSATLETKLRFASEEKLLHYLGLTPGSVSPFGLINDTDHSVRVIVDKDVLNHQKVSFHPNINTETLVISSEDLQKFLTSVGNPITYFPL